jgi:uracil-DNA glycosylase family 4
MLFDIDPETPSVAPSVQTAKVAAAKKALVKRIAKSPRKLERGCDFCPQNAVEGIRKVKGFEEVKGRKIMLWAQNPGKDENKEGKALIGRAGQLLWKDAALVGLTREMCDVQNVVRCRTPKEELVPNDYGEKELRIVDGEPSKEVAHCCSLYTEQAIQTNGGKALVHIVLGTYAAKTLLGREYRKDKKVFWSKNLKAHVICTYHPSYFNRGGSASRREQFRSALQAAKEIAEGKSSRFAFIEEQDYQEQPPTKLKELYNELLAAAKAGVRIVPDIEDGKNDKGTNVLVMIGFCYKPGHVKQVFYDHPEANPKYMPVVEKFFRAVFENAAIRKSMHHGSYDAVKLWKFLKIKVRGYDFDTNYAEYMAYSDRKAYGLAAIAESRFPKFAGYKDILEPYYEEGTGTKKNVNFYKVPKRVLIRYNGGDCDLSKRIELTTKKKVDPSLMKVFILAGFTMDEMQERGPLFDYKYYPILEKWIPQRLEILRNRLKVLTKNPTFNCNAPKQVYDFAFEKLHLENKLPDDWIDRNGLNTQKETMGVVDPLSPVPATGYRHETLK